MPTATHPPCGPVRRTASRATIVRALAATLVCLAVALPSLLQPASAFSATLYDDNRCSQYLRAATKLESGACFANNDYTSALITCNAAGTADVKIFFGQQCATSSMGWHGSGTGNGMYCIVLSAPDGSGDNGVRVDCAAPGPDAPAGSLSGVGLIVVVVVCCAVGSLVLGSGAYYCYKRRTRANLELTKDGLRMRSQQMTPGPPDRGTSGVQPYGVQPPAAHISAQLQQA